jgi:hypothetical protein
VRELPLQFVGSGLRPVRRGQAGGFDGIGGGAEGVRTHVADGGGLARCSGRGSGGGYVHATRSAAIGEPSANPRARIQLAPGERSGPRDRGARAAIPRPFRFEQPKNPIGTRGGPCCDKAPVDFAQRLRRPHHCEPP